MVWCISNRVSYSSSFNIFAVIGGIFLVKGSLKAARLISFFVAFFIAAFLGMLIIAPFLIPFDLIRTYIRLKPTSALSFASVAFFVFLLLIWIYRMLTSRPVRAAMDERKLDYTSFWRKPARGFWIGVCLAAFLLVFVSFFLGGSTAEQAKQRAAAMIGSGYKFQVTSLSATSIGRNKHFRANVTAYNDEDIRTILVEWSE